MREGQRARESARVSGPVLVGIGANLRRPGLGPLSRVPRLALARMAREGLRPLRLSPLYSSAPAPAGIGPAFVNAVAVVAAGLPPERILRLLHRVERAFGRRRRARDAPRPLDLDLLAHGSTVRAGAAPVLPHPGIAERPFVLRPLMDAAPRWRHPASGASAASLLARLRGARGARRLAPRPPPPPRKDLKFRACGSICKAGSGPRRGPLTRRRKPWHV